MSKVKLKPGDYVSTEGMTEEQYHAVARAFMEAGADNGLWEHQMPLDFFGWRKKSWRSGLLFQSGEGVSRNFTRRLTIEQVIGSNKEEEEMTLCEQRGCKVGASESATTILRQAKAALDKAQAEYDQALADVQQELGNDFVVSEAGNSEPQGDMADPANWRVGDVLERFRAGQYTTQGGLYTMLGRDGDGDPVIEYDDGSVEGDFAGNFRFHHRPS